MRRLVILGCTAAALVSSATAAAGLQPVNRRFGDLTIPRVRAGTVSIPAAHTRGTTRVIVTLSLPPLAAAYGRNLYIHGGARRLDAHSASAQAYLARVSAAQEQAIARLHAALPAAQVSRRFRILLDGLTVTLPSKQLPRLLRLGFAHVYPTYHYSETLSDSPQIIQAPQLTAATGDAGQGIKIGVVDDGIDQTNPFFDPAGYTYPAGFPKGNTAFTTPKVIVARAFPGPGSGKAGQLPLDRAASFHGTHVSGIAAGDAGTTAPAGSGHPAVTGLSGVAPRAYLGNYRVFNVPSPVGNLAETPEIIAAFESAVADGMQVINFSGGGAQTDPINDPMIETIHNVVAAGVVPVIAAGNDRDDFGFGTAGSPGTAPDAISVAATSNNHVFNPTITVLKPQLSGPEIPYQVSTADAPSPWGTIDQRLVDVGTLLGTNGAPVDRKVCGALGNLNGPGSNLRPGSLAGSIALVSRGDCTFVSKSDRLRAAGAIGIVFVDNRPGEANGVAASLSLPQVMISDFDGARLRLAMAATAGVATVRLTRDPKAVETGRGAVITSFSSAGPTAFGHQLKPDISAPGGNILSSTLKEFAGSNFAVFDGTSMATPHVAGAVALLLERHPTWTPPQVKSALMSTAGPAFGDSARTTEAIVPLEGAGLAQVQAADDPQIFTDPQSLSYGDLNVAHSAASNSMLITLDDAGDGAGSWQVSLQVQSASPGATVTVPGSVDLAPGGEAFVPVVAKVAAGGGEGDNFGFVVLTKGSVTRRVPYLFEVTRQVFSAVKSQPLHAVQAGQTVTGANLANVYRWPSASFGPSNFYSGKPTVFEPGAEQLYRVDVNAPVVNVGAAVVLQSSGSVIDPWFLGSPDPNDVQGYAGTPVNVNAFMFDFKLDVEAAGTVFPRQKAYYIAVDSPQDQFTGRSLPGRYVLRGWINDVSPPLIAPVTTKVGAGHPTLVVRALDLQSGVDPLSLVIAYGRVLIGAAFYDPITGIAIFPLPAQAPKLTKGKTQAVLVGSDFQETKNVATIPGQDLQPNTVFAPTKLTVVNGPALTWLLPDAGQCVSSPATTLTVVGSSPAALRSVTFYDGAKKIGSDSKPTLGLFSVRWKHAKAAKGTHRLRAVLEDGARRTASAPRAVKVCGKK